MSLDKVSPGKKLPESFNVIIEISMNADPIKYEVDKESGAIFVDRFMGTAMHYPCNYGYIPKTIAGDGDPVDVLVITPFPVIQSPSEQVPVEHRIVPVLKYLHSPSNWLNVQEICFTSGTVSLTSSLAHPKR